MKNMTFKRSKLGFTLAELLLVIAILVVLVGLGVTGFVALRQNIIIAKYDDLAREIYVAAQNQLTRLEANGIDQDTLTTLQGTPIDNAPKDYTGGNWDEVKANFRHADKSSQAMTVLLPLGAVADDVRSTGYYVIEYNVQTRTVYGVFYSAESFAYTDVIEVENFRTSRSARKGPMVGYYGGSAVERDPQTHCPTPKLEIINNNELRLNILEVPTDVTGISVKITDSEGKYAVVEPVVVDGDTTKKTVLLDSMEKNKHFHQLFDGPKPGSDLTITVTYTKTGSISSSASITANSLFATREKGQGEEGDTVTLAWARHLQNLEPEVSNLNDDTITKARQTEHIQWVEAPDFVSINNPNLKRFEGSRLEIRDLKGSNGLFAQTKEGMELSAIRIVNPVIDGAGTDPVGALVGTAASGTKIEWCGVYANKVGDNQKIDYSAYKNCYVKGETATTGGLVGQAMDTTVQYSFAALPTINGGSGASLIGSATNCKIQESYANCDNLQPGFNYFVSGQGNTINHCYAVGNVDSEQKGSFAGTGTVTDSYYAVSHRHFAEQWANNKDLAATEFSYIGKTGGWQTTNEQGMRDATKDGGWATGSTNPEWVKTIAPLSHPYRQYLDGRAFPYPAIGELDHYGSWPDDDGTVNLTIDLKLLNSLTDQFANFAGTVVVKVNNKPIFNSEDHDSITTIPVSPDTEVTIEITPKDGYAYSHTTIDGAQASSEGEGPFTVTHTVNKDTNVVVTFRQGAFKLTAKVAENESHVTDTDRTYHIDLTSPSTSLLVSGNDVIVEKVETGSTVTVRPTKTISSVVWYIANGKTVYVNKDQDGNYTFPMPAGDTEVHVMYTNKTVTFNLSYLLMDTHGNYQTATTQTNEYTVGLGTQIKQSMIDRLAEGSGLPLIIDGERVRYLAEATVTDNSGKGVFHCKLNEKGEITVQGVNHVTLEAESAYNIEIKIARKMYSVTLTADTNVEGVRFENSGSYQPSVEQKYYYGADVTAEASVEPGYSFTFWDPKDTRFMMSAEQKYKFQVPHFNLNLHAIAATDRYLVTINLLENDESWLFNDPSRRADPIKLTLVSTKDPHEEYPMQVLTEDKISYAMQAVVPSIMEYGEGYEVKVEYEKSKLKAWIYAGDGGDGNQNNANNPKLRIYVRDHEVEETAKFYSVTYHPNRSHYLGTVPQGGTYPMYYHLTVQGNTGLLHYDPKYDENDPAFFTSWLDYYADGTGSDTIYTGDEILTVTRRTDMFAQWATSLNVRYDGNGADGGELPVHTDQYQQGSTVTVRFTNLSRTGYTFLGWSEDPNAATATYTQNGTKTFQLGETSVTLYAIWAKEKYTVEFYGPDGQLLKDKTKQNIEYGTKVDVPELTETIVGWALERGGDIVCQPDGQYTVTGDTKLYACTADDYVKVIFKSMDGKQIYKEVNFGKDIPGYLDYVPTVDGNPAPVTAWSTLPNGKGRLYLCDESGRSEKAYAFSENITLYAVTGKVYNYNKQTWYNTLYAAVRDDENTANGDTLIVYRDTTEEYSVWINKSIYVLAHGNRTVQWKDGAENGAGGRLDQEAAATDKELAGCMGVGNVTVEFGRSDIPALSMGDSTLTFDANKQSRVMALGPGARFHMYDGITLTNGKRDGPRTGNGNGNVANRSVYGGGVYAGAGSEFYMHGGTISFCNAVSGGGVYLFTGSRMYMGDMVPAKAYSATATYYKQVHKVYPESEQKAPEDVYENEKGVTPENYHLYYVTAGNPQICYNHALHSYVDQDHSDGGGGLLMYDLNNGELTLFCGSITNNTTTAHGGGVLTDSARSNCFLRIYEVDISHNTAEGDGGGIFQWQGTVYVYNSTIRQNKARKGGGIYLNQIGGQTCNIEFYYGDISNNEAAANGNEGSGNGGGIAAQGKAQFLIDGGNLVRNKAQNGGGAYMAGSSVLNFEKGTVSDNEAVNDGGGIYSTGTVEMKRGDDDTTGGTLSGNKAGNYGGGIYFTGTMTMSDGTICNNEARYLGGGIMAYNDLTLSGGALYGNEDTDYQGEQGDEDNETYGANDIYLVGMHVIMIPNGGIQLSGEKRVAVDCDHDGGKGRFDINELPRKFAQYARDIDYKPEDTLLFTYNGTRSTNLSTQKNLSVFTHQQLPGSPDVGLYFAENNDGKNSSIVAFDLNYMDCVNPEAQAYQVGTPIEIDQVEGLKTERPGYYLAGWARTPDALEEEYELFYDVVENQWKTGYNGTNWQNIEGNKPIYTVKDLSKQTLYAMWRPCVVVYNLGEGKGYADIQSTSVGPRVTILNPHPMSYKVDGMEYFFDHWEGDDRKTYSPMQQVELEKNLRLTAQWNGRTENTVIITFHFNDGTSDQTGELLRQVEVQKNTEYTINVKLHRANKILIGWNTRKDAKGKDYNPDDKINTEVDMDLYAQWADAVTLTYDVNGGKESSTVTSYEKDTEATISDFKPTRDGYEFLGWSDDPNATEPKYRKNDKIQMTRNITLYAVWLKLETFKVTFDLAGGQGMDTTTIEVVQGKTFTVPGVELTKEGRTFGYWVDAEGNHYRSGAEVTPTSDLALTAVWQCTVTFKLNYDGAPQDIVKLVKEGTDYTIDVENPAERPGYRFLGWSQENHFTSYQDILTKDQVLSNVNSSMTLYAVWVKQRPGVEYTISFKLMGGSWSYGNDPSYEKAEGEDFTVPKEKPTKSGKWYETFTFIGWQVTYESASVAVVEPDDKIPVQCDLTFTALWEEGTIWSSTSGPETTPELPAAVLPGEPVTVPQGDGRTKTEPLEE